MATLAEAVDAAETDWLVSADVPDSVDYLTVESEVVQVTATFPAQYQAADGSTSEPRIRVVRGAGGTTAASHADTTALTPLIPPSASGGGGTTLTPDIEDALNGAFIPSAANVFATIANTGLDAVLLTGNDAGGLGITGLLDPTIEQDAATKVYVDNTIGALDLAALLLGSAAPESPENADGNDTGGVEIRHDPAVDVDALASLTAIATGTGGAITRAQATVVNGDAIAGPRGDATGTGNVDACAYARSVDGQALADNDAAATGIGEADAGGYALSFDGSAFSGGVATATGSGLADASDLATANTGIALAGTLAVRGASSAGMKATVGVDGIPMLGFNAIAATPIAIPVIPAVPTEQDIADVLVALGLATQTP